MSKPTTKSAEKFAELSNRGFSFKQIGNFWKLPAKNIAAYAGQARRKGLLSN